MSIIYNGYVTKFKYELLNEINVDHCAIWFLNHIKVYQPHRERIIRIEKQKREVSWCYRLLHITQPDIVCENGN